MTESIQPFNFADLHFVNDFPHSNQYDDRYFLNQYGLAETEYVYLFNKEISKRFIEQQNFVIGEIGFGIGLNFLATLSLWMKTTNPDNTLIYISCELNPLRPEDLKKSLQVWEKQLGCTQLLIDAYQTIAPGLNTFVFLEAKVILILLVGSAEEQLALCSFKANHWMLDGFSPSKNPSAWSDDLIKQIARLSAPEGTLATFSAAGFVRRSLENHGWNVKKLKGFGTKRHRLTASRVEKINENVPAPCLVLGTGIAGVSFQFFRSFLGHDVQAFDTLWPKASMVPQAYAHPAVQSTLSPFTLFGLRSHTMSSHFYRQLCAHHGLKLGEAPTMQRQESRRAEMLANLSIQPLYQSLIKIDGDRVSFPQGYTICGPLVLNALASYSQKGHQLYSTTELPKQVKLWQNA
jgi:tRNA 5-methylaminomethyl-2-thiouridine biosynthesis bifunctional protein